jgi:photosystem II stability/assembly factor-like uncharacterized protein
MKSMLRTGFPIIITLMLLAALAAFAHAQTADQNLIKDLKWRNIGPANMQGRISDLKALDNDFTTVLLAGASGGVWKSNNAGTTWEPIFEKYGSASIGDTAFFQKDPNIIWVGTGEECGRNSVAWGDGIYKSTDGGKTFTRMGLETTQAIGRVITHPTDPNVVFVAAVGHLWGYSGERGLFKTMDGGKSWQKLTNGLPNDGKTGAIDLIMDPSNPNILYVSFWQRLRQPWRFDSGGPNGGIFKTIDGGKTWKKLTKGLPAGDIGRIGLAISRTNPKVLQIIVEAAFQPQPSGRGADGQQQPNPDYADMTKLGSGIYRSEDAGESWVFMNRMNVRPFYYSHIYLNPVDDRIVYVAATSLQYSEDKGKTFNSIGGLHPDFHAMWFDPTNKNRFYAGQDGGAALTYDHGKTFVFFDNVCLAQFYAVSTDMRDPYFVYGGLQDNGTWGGPSMSREGSILTDFWFNIGGGDGFHTQNDPTDWRIVYGESQGGSLQRTNVETRESRGISPRGPNNILNYNEYYPAATSGQPQGGRGGAPGQAGGPGGGGRGGGSPLRFNWSAPILVSPHNAQTLYFGGNHVFKSTDRGDHWQIISQDLTTNDRQKYGQPNGGLTGENTGAETHCTIITIAESPLTPGLLWVGTDDGNVQLTRNGGASWTNVRENVPGVPNGLWASRVEASHFSEGTCYLTFEGHRSDDFKPYVFKTTDYGKTWTSITNNLPDGQPVYVIREDPKNRNLLFLGTEFAVFFSRNGGSSWTNLNLNMPTVAFHDLLIHPRDNDLIAATHGRGFWILDDISALQQMDKVADSEFYLFENKRPGTRWLRMRRGGYGRGDLYFRGENPPEGALVHYYLKNKPDSPAAIEITDVTGTLKTTYILDNAQPGVNRLVWDFRFDPSAQQVQQIAASLRKQLELAVQRLDLTAQQRDLLQKSQQQLDRFGANYRKVMEIQRSISLLLAGGGRGGFGAGIGFGGGGFGGFGGAGSGQAEPGTYAVRLTVNGKTSLGTIVVRLDPIQTGGN